MKATIAIAIIACASIGVYAIVSDDGDKAETISIQGSTTISPYMLKVQEVYEKKFGVGFEITSNGSGTGASAVINGVADLAMLSRDLKPAEKDKGLIQTVIGVDGIMTIANNDAGVSNITVENLEKIYSGEITNWNEIGGANKKITVITRDEGSGTRDGFEEALKDADPNYKIADEVITQKSTNAVIETVNKTTGAIGYISIGYAANVGSNTTILSLNGVAATEENVINGSYGIQRNLVLATMGEPSGATKDLIDWILGTEGQQLLVESGFISKV